MNNISPEDLIRSFDPVYRALWCLGYATSEEGGGLIRIAKGSDGSGLRPMDVRLLGTCLTLPEDEIPRVLAAMSQDPTTTLALKACAEILEARLGGRRFEDEEVLPLHPVPEEDTANKMKSEFFTQLHELYKSSL